MKNRTYIKKAAVCVMTAGIMAAMLAGCGNSSDSNGAKEATAVADTEVTEGNANTSVDYSYTKHVADEGYSEYDETYELALSDDTNAVFYDITNYSDVRCITNMYKGTYVKTDDSVTFTYQDPDDVDFVIPGNDDAVRSVKVILGVLANAICESRGLEIVDYVTEDESKVKAKSDKEEVKENKKEVKAEVKEAPKAEEKEEVVEEVKEESEDLSSKTLTELKAMAKEKAIKGYSTMKKDELIASLK